MLTVQIDEDLKSALKAKNDTAASALRNLKAALQNAEIEKRSSLTDDDARKVIAKKVKQHKDSIESFQAGGRSDLVATEQAQMAVLEKYLPQPMDESQVAELVKSTIAEMNAKASDFGRVIKEVMAKAQGQTDGGVVSRLIKEQLK